VSEENKELVHRFVEEFWNQKNPSAADELMAADVVIHMPTGEVVDLEGLKGFAEMWRGSFPDWNSTFEELIAEGDRVAERWTGRGTHQGELQGIPPTGSLLNLVEGCVPMGARRCHHDQEIVRDPGSWSPGRICRSFRRAVWGSRSARRL
jgi:predicted ester cyclase